MLNPAPRGSGGQKPLHMNVGDFCSGNTHKMTS